MKLKVIRILKPNIQNKLNPEKKQHMKGIKQHNPRSRAKGGYTSLKQPESLLV